MGGMTREAYDRLAAKIRDVSLLSSASALLGWDQETMMPEKGGDWRAEQLALLARKVHEDFTSDEVGELLAACEEDRELVSDPLSVPAVVLRELRRDFDLERKLPADLVAESASHRSRAQQVWARARKESDFELFRPMLVRSLELAREEARCLGIPEGGEEPWDALADRYEPGMRAAELARLFEPLRSELVELVDRHRGRRKDRLTGRRMPVPAQETLCRRVSEAFGFDFDAGRLDRSTHPFTSGSHPLDVRITTRYREEDVMDALGSTTHEVGHGLYEQGLPPEHAGLPFCRASSTGIHESQSRLWENQVGRSLPFWRWCAPLLTELGGKDFADLSPEELFESTNRAEPSLIRVDADETTYHLHIQIRFELELAMFRGDLDPADLPSAWNERYAADLGVEVPDDARGCLQDIHWSLGAFGYFPTYSLGNLYAACFWKALRGELPDVDEDCARGDFGGILEWLRSRIHRHGARYRPAELCEEVCGTPLDPEVFLDYLRDKHEA